MCSGLLCVSIVPRLPSTVVKFWRRIDSFFFSKIYGDGGYLHYSRWRHRQQRLGSNGWGGDAQPGATSYTTNNVLPVSSPVSKASQQFSYILFFFLYFLCVAGLSRWAMCRECWDSGFLPAPLRTKCSANCVIFMRGFFFIPHSPCNLLLQLI